VQPKQVAGVSSWQIQLDWCLFYEHCLEQWKPLFNPIILDEVSLWPKMLCGIGPYLVGSDPLTSTTAFSLSVTDKWVLQQTRNICLIYYRPISIHTIVLFRLYLFMQTYSYFLCVGSRHNCALYFVFFRCFPHQTATRCAQVGTPSPLYPSFFFLDQDHVSNLYE
jgi:hypothetical protein